MGVFVFIVLDGLMVKNVRLIWTILTVLYEGVSGRLHPEAVFLKTLKSLENPGALGVTATLGKGVIDG